MRSKSARLYRYTVVGSFPSSLCGSAIRVSSRKKVTCRTIHGRVPLTRCTRGGKAEETGLLIPSDCNSVANPQSTIMPQPEYEQASPNRKRHTGYVIRGLR